MVEGKKIIITRVPGGAVTALCFRVSNKGPAPRVSNTFGRSIFVNKNYWYYNSFELLQSAGRIPHRIPPGPPPGIKTFEDP